MAGANTWPIVLVSYLYVKKDQTATNPRTAAALKASQQDWKGLLTKAFIDMVVTDTDGMAAEFGFTPPSATLKALSRNAADAIVYPTAMQSFTVETSTNVIGGMATNVCLARMVFTWVQGFFRHMHKFMPRLGVTCNSVQDQFQASLLRHLRQQCDAGRHRSGETGDGDPGRS